MNTEMLSHVAKQMKAGNRVEMDGKVVEVKRTSSQRLKTLRFVMGGREYQAIEQNPEKPSRWGQLARKGHHVVQFRERNGGQVCGCRDRWRSQGIRQARKGAAQQVVEPAAKLSRPLQFFSIPLAEVSSGVVRSLQEFQKSPTRRW
jgi:hypothetical protein